MANGGNPNRLSAFGELVDDPVSADPQRVEAAEPSTQRVAGRRFTLEQAQRILDRVNQRPTQLEQVAAGPPREDNSCQESEGRGPTLRQFLTELAEGDGLVALELGKTHLER